MYRAEELKHGREVAMKVLSADLSYTIGAERFRREIHIAARLQHPHILPVFDSGEAGGLLYYVMPFVEGESLYLDQVVSRTYSRNVTTTSVAAPAGWTPDRVVRTIIRVSGIVLVIGVIGYLPAGMAGMDSLFWLCLTGTLIGTVGVLLTPLVALVALSIVRPSQIGPGLYWAGQASAALLFVVGIAIAVQTTKSVMWLTIGTLSAAAAGWTFARSLHVEARRSTAPLGREYGFAIVVAFLSAAMFYRASRMTHFDASERSRLTAVKSDLRNLSSAQADFRDSAGRYATLPELRRFGWRTFSDVYVVGIADSASWRAYAAHAGLAWECRMWVGRQPTDPLYAGPEGELICR